MAEYIERERALEAIMGEFPDAHYPSWYAEELKKLPTVDVAEVRHGRWEFINGNANCTNCGTIFESLPTEYAFERNNIYCRHCGAKMDGRR